MPPEKRNMSQATTEPSKKRAPYTPRACDTCRKRKGRCNGRRPCEYCLGRSFQCHYTLNLDENRNEQPHISGSHTQQAGRDPRENGSERLDSLGELVANMQGQLNALVAHMKMSSDMLAPELTRRPGEPGVHGTMPSSEPPAMIEFPNSSALSPTTDSGSNTRPSRRAMNVFCGPTSPEYSLNAAQRKMQHEAMTGVKSRQTMAPSIDDEQDQNSSQASESPMYLQRPSEQTHQASLLRFRNMIPLPEAIRLLRVYNNVIGELHPICDIEELIKKIETYYSRSDSERSMMTSHNTPIDEDDLLMVNLAIAIALSAESGSSSDADKTIYDNCSEIIKSKLASTTEDIKQVSIILLVGIHHFFKAAIRLAWRMCGLAGRMAMELGLHNQEMSQHCLESDDQRTAVVNLSCSILVLDRQWSAAAGLPNNFQESDFDAAIVSAVKVPYMKSMMTFTFMSHKFNEPISKAAKGEAYTDDDSFEVTNFLIEQWRKRFLENHNFADPSMWESMPSTRPPSWTIILYLRANSVRSILLRPFFLSDSATDASKRHIAPALDFITDSINILSVLDRTTNIYRTQHPFLQHFLAGACALLFLLLVHTAQNRAAISPSLPHDFLTKVNKNFWKALDLSQSYVGLSISSRKLHKRLTTIKEPLLRVGFLSNDECPAHLIQPDPGVMQQIPYPLSQGPMVPEQLPTAQQGLGQTRNGELQPVTMASAFSDFWNPMFGASPGDSAFNANFEFSDYDWPSGELANCLLLDGSSGF
ncbi:hypothetical protein PV08_05936 [Exophiala spinifera]|uniref:Zn(2)-C6 fungal-type domain-containing protein n=1 Tax=Exophiala spinifera TaxID=91928 RepID=A0A0D1YLH8_9EURO|nr:uncharacterized protein PV08_05936 [Exophiala spinifera]KIW15886.1 hypothetical protein PV08_05936 [Exophiala spinifera]